MTQDRFLHLNLPHARTVVERIERSLQAHGAFEEVGNGRQSALRAALAEVRQALRPWEDDPAYAEALAVADAIAVHARRLVDAILATPARGDRLGQNVRNLFECLGLVEEGRRLSLLCGEKEDSLLR